MSNLTNFNKDTKLFRYFTFFYTFTFGIITKFDKNMVNGLIHIYTGDGKGKTTSAIGLAARAIGGGLRVCYISFHKQPEKYGYTEKESLKKLGVVVLNRAKGHPHLDKTISSELLTSEVKEALIEIEEMMNNDEFDLIIMDEIIISVRDKFIEEELLLEFVKRKQRSVELVMTGRGASEDLIKLADYVSNVEKVKHPYDNGITSRKGIEF